MDEGCAAAPKSVVGVLHGSEPLQTRSRFCDAEKSFPFFSVRILSPSSPQRQEKAAHLGRALPSRRRARAGSLAPGGLGLPERLRECRSSRTASADGTS